MPRRVLVLGSTGSVGTQTLSVLETLRDTHTLVGLLARASADALLEQAVRFRPSLVGLVDPEAARRLRGSLPHGYRPETVEGPDAIVEMVRRSDADIVLSAVAGAAGLPAAVETLRRGRTLALANKEALVMAGGLLRDLERRHGGRILPVDSEHCGVFQCLEGRPREDVRRIVLTASGGPFRTTPAASLAHVQPEEALRHPVWSMGRRITIDSATLMNKALEVVEAAWLFDVPPDAIEVLVHPQGIVHAIVEFRDGSLLAQLAVPDMRLPIRFALTFPTRAAGFVESFPLERLSELTFERPDLERFPALGFGYDAARTRGVSGSLLNAADEIAVERFLRREIPFPGISRLVKRVVDGYPGIPEPSLDDILTADRWARAEASRAVG